MNGTIVTNDGLAVGDTAKTYTVERPPVSYINIRIDPMLWQARLQDLGCQKQVLIKKKYEMNSVISFRPKEDKLFYKSLSATSIDIVKSIVTETK